MGEIVLGLVALGALYLVWETHRKSMASLSVSFEKHMAHTEALLTALQARTLEERGQYEKERAETQVAIREIELAYADDLRKMADTAKAAQDVVNEINGQITVSGIDAGSEKRNMSLAQFYKKFEEVV